eukprot:2990575-Rhodomonas_salina.2
MVAYTILRAFELPGTTGKLLGAFSCCTSPSLAGCRCGPAQFWPAGIPASSMPVSCAVPQANSVCVCVCLGYLCVCLRLCLHLRLRLQRRLGVRSHPGLGSEECQ